MKEINLNGLHKKILFMISLPQTAEFEANYEMVSECINKLSERGVDVRDSFRCEDLSTICQYDIVILVAHHDTDRDALLLRDKILPISDFVKSLPESFSGELDFSSCYSASVANAIKERCPNCHIQASVHQTTLALRLMTYPYVVDLINEDESIEYHDAYMKVLDMILEAISDVSDGEEGKEIEHVKLGQDKTSVYSPREVMPNSVFQIMVFIYYDAEKEVIKAKAKRRHNNSEIWDDFDIPISLEKDDEVAITLSFDSTDYANIKVKNDEYTKYVTLKDGIVEEEFVVTILPDFQGNNFLAQIEMAKDEECFLKTRPFEIKVTNCVNMIPADIDIDTPNPRKIEEEIIFEKEEKLRILDFSTMKKFMPVKNGKITNLAEIYDWLKNNHYMEDWVTKDYLLNCISHAEFSPLYVAPNKKNILYFIFCLTHYYQKEWMECACSSINVARKRLNQNRPKNYHDFDKNIVLRFK